MWGQLGPLGTVRWPPNSLNRTLQHTEQVRGEVPVSRVGAGRGRTHHDAGEQTHALPAVGVRHHVSVADGQEGDGDKPHGSQEVAGHFLLVMVPGVEDRQGWVIHAALTTASITCLAWGLFPWVLTDQGGGRAITALVQTGMGAPCSPPPPRGPSSLSLP